MKILGKCYPNAMIDPSKMSDEEFEKWGRRAEEEMRNHELKRRQAKGNFEVFMFCCTLLLFGVIGALLAK